MFTIATPIKKVSSRYKVMCGCECCISYKLMHSSLISWHDHYLKKTKDIIQNYQTGGLGKKQIHIYETYKNIVMPHGRHIYAKSYDTAKATWCANSLYDHALPHWKCVLICCAQCPSIDISDQETDDRHPNPSTSISFNIYHLIARCTKHDRIPLTNKKSCRECQYDTASVKSTNIYNRKEIVMMETIISNLHTSF